MSHTQKLNGWRASLRKILWLPFSLMWGAIVLAGMWALEFVFSHKQKLKREEGFLWGILNVSYWVLAAVFTGEWRMRKPDTHSAEA